MAEYCAPVPKHDAFQRSFVRLTPQTLKAVNGLVVQAAVDLGLEDGAKLRVDTNRALDRGLRALSQRWSGRDRDRNRNGS